VLERHPCAGNKSQQQKQHVKQQGDTTYPLGSDLDSPSTDSSDTDTDPPPQKRFKIPKYRHHRTQAEIAILKADLQNLSQHPDEFFHSTNLQELISLDNKLGGSKSAKKLTERLAKNLEKAKKVPKQVPAGLDNRADLLHEARFLPGHTCKNTELWLRARELLGLTGQEPVSKYDSEGLGLGGRINSYIWAQLHNPGSKRISIRMLSPPALEAARGDLDKEASHPTRDFENMHDLKMAVHTLRAASRLALPWNFAFETLDLFLSSVQFGEKQSGFWQNNFGFVTKFIDQVINLNAENWDDRQHFLTFADLRGKWLGDIGERTNRGGGNFPRTDQRYRQTARDTNTSQKPATDSATGVLGGQRVNQYIPGYLCRNYNYGKCKITGRACQAVWDPNQELLHQCGFLNKDTKKYCLQNHPYIEHK
jgi:hypothetical protein